MAHERDEDIDPKTQSLLLSAMEEKDATKLSHLLAKITGDETRNRVTRQLFLQASITRNRDIFEVLYTDGAAIKNATTQWDDMPPFHFAIANGNVAAVEGMIELGADVNIADDAGMTPLHAACSFAYFPLEGVKKLLAVGADCNRSGHGGFTPLHLAVAGARPEVVRILLENGADMHLKTNLGETNLSLALSWTTYDFKTKCVKFNRPTSSRIKQDKISCARILLEKGFDIRLCDTDDISILNAVVRSDISSVDLLTLLLSKGADVNQVDTRTGHTPLMGACYALLYKQTTDFMKVMLEHGANINAKCKNGNTVLHIAAQFSRVSIVLFLIDNGADVHALNNNNLTFLDYVSPEIYLYLINALLGKGVYPKNIIKDDEMNQFLFELEHRFAKTPLMLALWLGKKKIANRFKDIGFLTREDMLWLPGNMDLRNKLPQGSVETYDSLVAGPCPLKLISFVTISDLLGNTSSRQEKVKQLGLPIPLQRQLLFKTSRRSNSTN
ncbi:ankyrin-3 [Plakobranchus ocellatus]|uniref:Ankyrin-3 n=1 Tax=Plakobranchus ocellatus TaxID=259542 RepID=A0AAV4AMK0_9GAST|nr:ankyrin-3 [Plakobranchus ocellatus]